MTSTTSACRAACATVSAESSLVHSSVDPSVRSAPVEVLRLSAGDVEVQRLDGGDVGRGGLCVEQGGLLAPPLGCALGVGEQGGVALACTFGTIGRCSRGHLAG